MKLVKQKVSIVDPINGEAILKKIEQAGRVCYKSESNITEDSAKKFVSMILKRGHESVLEHVNLTLKFKTDRGVTHELVRHRLASFSQESTRYVNYKGGMEAIVPIEFYRFIKDKVIDASDKFFEMYRIWVETMEFCEIQYQKLIELGAMPQLARSVLPNSLKTEIVVTANLREWRHIFKLRCAKAAHPQIQNIMLVALITLSEKIPIVFDDLVAEAILI